MALTGTPYTGPTKTAHPPPATVFNEHHGRITAAPLARVPAYPFIVRPYGLHGPVRGWHR